MFLEISENGLHFFGSYPVSQGHRMSLPFEIFDPYEAGLVGRIDRRCCATEFMALSAFIDKNGLVNRKHGTDTGKKCQYCNRQQESSMLKERWAD